MREKKLVVGLDGLVVIATVQLGIMVREDERKKYKMS